MPSSDGGGKAREWTLKNWPRSAFDAGGNVVGGGLERGEEVVVVEKEWADRQLNEAAELLRLCLDPDAEPDSLEAETRRWLTEHGRLIDDS